MTENSSNRGIVLDAKYWHVKGITIKGAGDNGMLLSGHYNIIENVRSERTATQDSSCQDTIPPIIQRQMAQQ